MTMMKTTPFGTAVRELRAQREMTLRQMAQEIGWTPAYLSSIEVGRKPLTPRALDQIKHYFEARGVDTRLLDRAADETQDEVNVSGLDPKSKAALAAFARSARTGSPEYLRDVEIPEWITDLVQNRKGDPDK